MKRSDYDNGVGAISVGDAACVVDDADGSDDGDHDENVEDAGRPD